MPPEVKKSNKIDIGLVEPFEQPWKAKCKYFPSKLGGRPSFLALDPILGPDQLTCVHCGQAMRFIFQAYVPIETNPRTFHRTLFVFGCGRSGDCANEVRVFRSQLARKNRFYSDAPPDYDRDEPEYDPRPEKYQIRLCSVCGIQGPHRCGQCQESSYCSKEHQVAHWKVGGHKESCGKGSESVASKTYQNYGRLVFKEESIILAGDSDTENGSRKFDDDGDEDDDDDQDVTESEMSKYQDFVKTQKPSLQNENLDPYAGGSSSSALSKESDDPESEDQLVFNRFKTLTLDDEVFRYRMDWFEDPEDCEDILWISSKNRLQPRESSTGYAVPNCPECGSERKFELQILPQMLNYLKEEDSSGPKKQNPIAFDDHLDWGTILVFSCPKSCAKIQTKDDDDEDTKLTQLEYYQEYVYHQPVGH